MHRLRLLKFPALQVSQIGGIARAATLNTLRKVELVVLAEQVVPAVVVLYLEKEALAEKVGRLARTARLVQMVLQEQMALEPSLM